MLKWYLHIHRKKNEFHRLEPVAMKHYSSHQNGGSSPTELPNYKFRQAAKQILYFWILIPTTLRTWNMKMSKITHEKKTWHGNSCRTTCQISPFGMLNSHLRGELKRSLFDTANTSRLCLHWDHIETKPSELHKIAAQMTKGWSLFGNVWTILNKNEYLLKIALAKSYLHILDGNW